MPPRGATSPRSPLVAKVNKGDHHARVPVLLDHAPRPAVSWASRRGRTGMAAVAVPPVSGFARRLWCALAGRAVWVGGCAGSAVAGAAAGAGHRRAGESGGYADAPGGAEQRPG